MGNDFTLLWKYWKIMEDLLKSFHSSQIYLWRGNYFLTLEKYINWEANLDNYGFKEWNLVIIVSGKNVGNSKANSAFFPHMYVYWALFSCPGKVFCAHIWVIYIYFFSLNLGQGWGVFPYHGKVGVKLGNISRTRR